MGFEKGITILQKRKADDPCVTNKQLNGHQITIVWHMGDLKVSYKDPWEVGKMARILSKI